MQISPHMIITVLAGSALAIPFAADGKNGTWPSTRLSTSISTIPTSSASSSTPTFNSTAHSHHHTSASVNYSYSTTTEIITKTIFIPCSTPVATFAGTTYFSTYLTTSVWTSTSCYPLSTPRHPQPIPAPGTTTVPLPPVETPHPSKECPTRITTVTVVETVTGPTQGGYWYPPSQCESCQTITYTDVSGNTVTIAIQNPPSPASIDHSFPATGAASNTHHWAHHASATGIPSNRVSGKWTRTASTLEKPTSSIFPYSFAPTPSANISTSKTKLTSTSLTNAGHGTTSSSSTVTATSSSDQASTSSSTSSTSATGTGNVKPSKWARL